MQRVQREDTRADTVGPDPTVATPETGAYKWWVLVTVVFGAFVSILDTTIVNTALPRMQAVFGADLRQASYISTGYTLAQGVFVAASGYLANRFGIKRIYLGSLMAFTIGSALCGLSWNASALILFRVLQGARGAALFPLAFALIFSVFPEEQRGLASGVFGIPVLVAPAIGPTVGGYLVQYADWRWIFFVNVPIGIAGVIMGWKVLRASPAQRDLRFDGRGFLLIASGLVLLLYGLSNLAYDGWGSLWTVSGPILLAVALLAIYVPVELRTPHPLLDLRLFRDQTFWAGNAIIWAGTVGLFGAQFLLPQYLQTLRGLAPFPAGLLLLPLGLSALVWTILSGVLYNRVGPRALIIGGAVVTAADTYLIGSWSTLTSAFSTLLPLLALRGLGQPFLGQTPNTVALQGVRGRALPGAITLTVVGRLVVSALAVAVLTNVLQVRRIAHQADLASQVNPRDPATAAFYARLVASLVRHGMAPEMARRAALTRVAAQATRQATALAFQDVYWLAAALTIPAIALTLLLRPQPRPSST